MNASGFQTGSSLVAVALILYALMSFFTGSCTVMGSQVRAAIEPALKSIRESSSLARQDLADASMVLSAFLAAAAAVVHLSVVAAIVAGLLWISRGSVKNLTKAESPLLALSSQFSGDLVVGFAAPLIVAHLLLGNYLLGAAIAAAVVALSWPAGGAGGRRLERGPWRPAWRN